MKPKIGIALTGSFCTFRTVMEVLKHKPEGYLLKTMTPGEILKALDDFFLKQKGGRTSL